MSEDIEEVRQVEITEENGIRHERNLYHNGDRVTLPKALADEFIRLGWAKCAATGEQGERVVGVHKLEVTPQVQ